MKNTGELLDEIREELEEDSSIAEDEREYSDKLLLIFMNDGYKAVRKIIKENNPSMLSTLVTQFFGANGSDEFDFDEDVLAVLHKGVKDTTNNRYLYPKEIQDFPENNTGAPRYYCLLGLRTFKIDCTPTSHITITIRYIPSATTLEYDEDDSTNSDIPLAEEFLPYIKDYVLLRAYNKNEAKADIETQFMVQNKSSILRILEDRLPIEMEGCGPWVV